MLRHNSVILNGVDEVITVADDADYDGDAGFTLCGWVCPTLVGPFPRAVISKTLAVPNLGWIVRYNPLGFLVFGVSGDGTLLSSRTSSVGMPVGRWSFWAAVFRPTALDVYTNGEKTNGTSVGGVPITVNPNTADVLIGDEVQALISNFAGYKAEYQFYKERALSDDNIRRIYKRGLCLDSNAFLTGQDDPFSIWKLGDGDDGVTAVDLRGNHNGVYTNMDLTNIRHFHVKDPGSGRVVQRVGRKIVQPISCGVVA